MAGSPQGATGRGRVYLPPVFWAAFAWLFVICLTQVDGATFYALVRGVGAVEYSDAIVVGSRALDFGLLAVVTVTVGWVPLNIGGWKWGSDPVRLGSLTLTLSGLVTAAVCSSPFAFLPLGLGALLLFAVDTRGLADHHGMPIGRSVALTALFGLAVLAVVAVVGDVRWVVGGFDGSTPFSDPSWSFSFVGLQIIAILDPVLPEITLLMLFGWVAWLVLPMVSRSAKAWFSAGYIDEGSSGFGVVVSRRASFFMLGAAVLISVFVGAYPYLHAVNPNSLIVGVDPRYHYSCILAQARIGPECLYPDNFYYYTHFGVFVLLRMLAAVGGSNLIAFEIAYPVLAMFLTVSTYIFAEVGLRSRSVAGVSALLASTSFQVVAGINAGFLANWLALCVAFLFFATLLQALRTRNLTYLVVACSLSVSMLFIHVWTWALTLGVVGLYSITTVAEAALGGRLRSGKTETIMLAAFGITVLAIDLARTLLPFGSGLSRSVEGLLSRLSLGNVVYLGQNFSVIFIRYLLGGLTDSVWYVFGAAGALALCRLRGDLGRLLASWLTATSFAFVFLASSNPDSDPIRFLYMLPIQLLGAIGFVSVLGGQVMPLHNGALGKRGAILLYVTALTAVVALAVGFALDNAGFVYRGVPGT